MKRNSAPPEIGHPPVPRRGGTWVQTERSSHEAWGHFSVKKPAASGLLHILVSKMGPQNAVVVSQKVLAEILGVTDRTVRNALSDLEEGGWIQIVKIGKGRECAYVVNDRVAWGQSRDALPLSLFSATIVADARDQDPQTLAGPKLRRIPVLFAGERQLPAGPGEPPPTQTYLAGVDLPELPALSADAQERAELEARGQRRLDVEQPDPWAGQRSALAAADERGQPRRIGNMVVTPKRGRRKE